MYKSSLCVDDAAFSLLYFFHEWRKRINGNALFVNYRKNSLAVIGMK